MIRPTESIRSEINIALGHKARLYWDTLGQYLSGKFSRAEFDELIRHSIDSPQLGACHPHIRVIAFESNKTFRLLINIIAVHLHNALIASILGSSLHQPPPTPPPDAPGKTKPTRKRKRTLPYQGHDSGGRDGDDPESGTLRSARIKRWIVGMGKKERERMKAIETTMAMNAPERPLRLQLDEISRERGLALPRERGCEFTTSLHVDCLLNMFPPAEPGTHMPAILASVSRALTQQHISDRINLISTQHDLGTPAKSCTTLLMFACEVGSPRRSFVVIYT